MIMTAINRKTVIEKYEEVSLFETHAERREFLRKQSEEIKVALWLENIERKTQEAELSAEQKEIIEVIRKKFITVEFAEFARGKSEEEAGSEYIETITRANQLLGKEYVRELFVVLGDSSTLKTIC